MEIAKIGKTTYRVSCPREYLEKFDLNYRRLDYGSQSTKEMLTQLLVRIEKDCGCQIKPEEAFVEIYPDKEGGCIIYFNTDAVKSKSECVGETDCFAVFADEDAFYRYTEATHADIAEAYRIEKGIVCRIAEESDYLIYEFAKEITLDGTGLLLLREYGEKTEVPQNKNASLIFKPASINQL